MKASKTASLHYKKESRYFFLTIAAPKPMDYSALPLRRSQPKNVMPMLHNMKSREGPRKETGNEHSPNVHDRCTRIQMKYCDSLRRAFGTCLLSFVIGGLDLLRTSDLVLIFYPPSAVSFVSVLSFYL